MQAHFRQNVDVIATALMAALIGLGIALIYSATHLSENALMSGLYRSQVLWALLGAAAFYLSTLVSSRTFHDFAYLFYFAALGLLVLVLFAGSTAMGATRWFALGPVKIQPSELAKIATVLALARYLSSKPVSFEKISTLAVPTVMVLAPVALIIKQPDLSTALVFCALFIPMLFWAGLSLVEVFFLVSPVFSLLFAFHAVLWALFFILLFALLVKLCRNLTATTLILSANFALGVVLPLVWGRLHAYQKTRILTFLDPQHDPSGAGYQVLQSQVAIGSGKFLGKGFLQGTQTRLSFLPEQHTDFIFSVLGEQFGFIGCLFVLVLFMVLLLRLLHLAGESNNRFLNLCVAGFTAQLAFHVFVNVAMTVGLMPVTGLPLPFLSYGGSFLITSMAVMGFAASIRKKSME